MTPREKNIAGIVSAVSAVLVVSGGFFAYGASRVAEVSVLKTKVETLEGRLERIENKLDRLLEKR